MNIYRPLQPEHKLKVFISSICGDECKPDDDRRRYALIRRELQALLESTDLFEVYNFDTESASSMSTRADYLTNIDDSDLVVFLIDNKDGISEGVRLEEKRARSKAQFVKRYYLFCTEYSSDKTEIQLTLEENPNSQPRFCPVSKFIELGERAYQAVMADVIKHYKLPDDVQKKQAGIMADAQSSLNSVTDLNVQAVDRGVTAVGDSFSVNPHVEAQVRFIQDKDLLKEKKDSVGSHEIDISSKEEGTEQHITRTVESEPNKDEDTVNKNQFKNVFALDRNLYEAPKQIGKYLTDQMLIGKSQPNRILKGTQENSNAQNVSTHIDPIVKPTLQLLSTLIGRSAFDAESFDDLSKQLIERQSALLKAVVKERLEAIKAYFLGDFASALVHERKSFEIADSIEQLPYWILNDIAIDIRNLVSMKARSEGDFRLAFEPENEGQILINNSIETVHYPILDRAVGNFEEKVIESYEKDYMQSPYTITFGSGLDSAFNNIGQAFWIALINGSYTQLVITGHHLITALKMITNIYDDHTPVVEMIRLILIQNEKIKDNIEAILRTYHGDADLLDADEAASLYQSIEWMPIGTRREQAEYQFFAYFSCYCSDNFFNEKVKEVIRNAHLWADDEKRNYWNNEDRYHFYDGLINRDRSDELIIFALELLKNTHNPGTLSSVKRDLCHHLRNVDYSVIDDDQISELLDYLIPLPSTVTVENEEATNTDGDDSESTNIEAKLFEDNPFLIDTIIQIALTKSKLRVRIIDGLEGAPAGVRNRLALEIEVNSYKKDKNIDVYKYIREYLHAAETYGNETKQGKFSEGTNYYGVIRNIIQNSKVVLAREQLEEISRYALDFLSVGKQLINQRVTCCEVLAILLANYDKSFDSSRLYEELLKCKDEYSTAQKDYFSNASPVQLKCAYLLMLIAGGYKGNDELIDLLYSIGNDQEYVKIQCLDILTQALITDKKNKFTRGVLNTICNFVLLISNSRERDTKFYCVRCLIELSRYRYTSELALRRLMLFMDGSNAQVRLATVARVKKSRFKDNPYVNAIMEKAKIDHHYQVRKLATA